MTAAGDELRSAVEALAEQALESDLTLSEVKEEYDEQYGPKQAIRKMAEDAGIVSSGRLPAKGTPQRTSYESFRRRLERYLKQGPGESRREDPRFVSELARRIGSNKAPGSMPATLNRIRTDGVNVVHIRVKIKGSGDKRARLRSPSFSVYIDPEGDGGDELLRFVDLAEDDDWDGAVDPFINAWAQAYGISFEITWEDLEGLTLTW